MMTVFENCALRAYQILAIERITDDPHEAWRLVAPSFTQSVHVQRKPCPIATFSGLWDAGKLMGSIPRPHYKALKNAQYAIDGITKLKDNPHLSKSQVWRLIPGTNEGTKSQDGQMGVLFALRDRGWIIGLS